MYILGINFTEEVPMADVGYDNIHFTGGIGQVPPQRGVNSEAKKNQKKRKSSEHDLSHEELSRKKPGLFEHDLAGIALLQQIFPGENDDQLQRIHLNNLKKKSTRKVMKAESA